MAERARIKLNEALRALDVPLTSAPTEWATAGQYETP